MRLRGQVDEFGAASYWFFDFVCLDVFFERFKLGNQKWLVLMLLCFRTLIFPQWDVRRRRAWGAIGLHDSLQEVCCDKIAILWRCCLHQWRCLPYRHCLSDLNRLLMSDRLNLIILLSQVQQDLSSCVNELFRPWWIRWERLSHLKRTFSVILNVQLSRTWALKLNDRIFLTICDRTETLKEPRGLIIQKLCRNYSLT